MRLWEKATFLQENFERLLKIESLKGEKKESSMQPLYKKKRADEKRSLSIYLSIYFQSIYPSSFYLSSVYFTLSFDRKRERRGVALDAQGRQVERKKEERKKGEKERRRRREVWRRLLTEGRRRDESWSPSSSSTRSSLLSELLLGEIEI